MQDQLLVKGRPNVGNSIFILLGGIAFATVCWNIMPWDIWVGNNGSDIGGAVIPVFMGGITLIAFQNVLVNYNTIYVYADRIEVISIFGKLRRTVLLADIQAYKKERVKNGKSSFEQYRLYTLGGRLEFTDDNCKNHLEVWAAVTDGRSSDESKIDDTFYVSRGWATAFAIAGVFFCAAGFYLFNKNHRPLAKDELIAVNGTFRTAYSSENETEIRLYEYPRISFLISGEAYAAMDTPAYFYRLAGSAAVSVLVERSIFESAARLIENDKKKKKKKQKYSTYTHDIPVYALKDDGLVYIALENYPHTRVLGNGGMLTWVGFGVLFLIIAAVIKYVERRQRA